MFHYMTTLYHNYCLRIWTCRVYRNVRATRVSKLFRVMRLVKPGVDAQNLGPAEGNFRSWLRTHLCFAFTLLICLRAPTEAGARQAYYGRLTVALPGGTPKIF